MSDRPKQSISSQFDLFLPYIADLSFRDQREMMERPFFSLSKSKRVKPIDYTSPNGKLWVHVSANPDYGIATIWDADILIYCASVLADMQRRGVNDIPRKLNVMPYDILRSIGRPTTGRAYELLGGALDRLVSTTVKTNIRAEHRREATFSWLDGWTQLVDERTERSRGMTLELSNWFYEGVIMQGGVLAIDRAYFDLTGGRERWLYKVARKHAGGAGAGGFAIALPTLFEKSGSEGQYRRFKFEINKIVESNSLPGYQLKMEQAASKGDPLVRMIRRDAVPTNEPKGQGGRARPGSVAPPSTKKAGPKSREDGASPPRTEAKPVDAKEAANARSMARRAIVGLSNRATAGFLTDETIDFLRRECPGWDLHTLHEDYKRWVDADEARTPVDWQKAFIGFVRRHDKKHRHELNRR